MKRYKSVIAADLLENADSGYKTYFCLHILYQTTMKKIQFITLLLLVAAVWISCKQAPAAEAETNSFGAGVSKPDGTAEGEMFVQFQDYGFFMPKDIAGREVIVEGKAYKQETSVEELKHYAEDAGKSAEEIAAITEPVMEKKFMATGVVLVK